MRVPGIPYVQGRNAHGESTKYGIAIHATDNDASAENEASYATRRTDGIGAHFYADADSVIQSLDTDDYTWHAGSSYGNHNAVAVELTGRTYWSQEKWLDSVAWDKLAQVLAVVCRHHGVAVRRASVDEMRDNPKVRAFYGHNDMRLAWGGTTHTDPGPDFPWDHLLARVRAVLDGEDDMTQDEAVTAARIAVHGLLKEAAAGSTPTGRQVAGFVRALQVDDTDEQAVADAIVSRLAAKPADDVARALVAAGQDPTALAAALAALAQQG